VAVASVPSMRHLDMRKRLEHMAALGFRPGSIVDVGAARGAWSRMAARIWPDAHIVGFEPNRSNEENLERTRHELPHFDYHHCFLGAEERSVVYLDRGPQTSLYSAEAGRETAEMRTLDACFEQGLFEQPQLLKLDVQGYELEVLKGGSRVLDGCEGVLAEVSLYRFHPEAPTVDEVIAFLGERDFALYDTMGLLRLPEDDALGQLDLMFVRSGHPLRRPRVW
jgi:FkbM family methyltransferase